MQDISCKLNISVRVKLVRSFALVWSGYFFVICICCVFWKIIFFAPQEFWAC